MDLEELDNETQIRLIRAESRIAVAEECASIQDAIRQTGTDIKEEMHNHFATKSDLAEWKLAIHDRTDGRIKDMIADCVKQNHKRPSRPPKSAKGGMSNKAIAAISGAIVAIGGTILGVIEWLSRG